MKYLCFFFFTPGQFLNGFVLNQYICWIAYSQHLINWSINNLVFHCLKDSVLS